MDYSFGNYKTTTPKNKVKPVSMFLWGPSGSGKTVLFSTAPGQKLLIQFDPAGISSVGDADDIHVVDVSVPSAGEQALTDLRNTDPMGLRKFLTDHPEIETVGLDSITVANDFALPKAVRESKNSTLQLPGQHGYAHRNTITHDVVKNLLGVCNELGRHLIIIGHEGTAEKDEMTQRIFKTFMLGGALPTLVPIRFSEIWHLEDANKKRTITLRSNPNKSPMKSRMFNTSSKDSFEWTYDPQKKTGQTLASWIAAWNANGGNSISPP